MEHSAASKAPGGIKLPKTMSVCPQDKILKYLHGLSILAAVLASLLILWSGKDPINLVLTLPFVLTSALCLTMPSSKHWWSGLLGAILGLTMGYMAQRFRMGNLAFASTILYGTTATNLLHRKLVYPKSWNQHLPFSMALVLSYALWLLFVSLRMNHKLSSYALRRLLDTTPVDLSLYILLLIFVLFHKKIPVVICLLGKGTLTIALTICYTISHFPHNAVKYPPYTLLVDMLPNLLWGTIPFILAFCLGFATGLTPCNPAAHKTQNISSTPV